MNHIIYIKTDGTEVIEHRRVAEHAELSEDEKDYFDYLYVRILSGLDLWAENMHGKPSKSISINNFITISASQVPNYVKAYVLLM